MSRFASRYERAMMSKFVYKNEDFLKETITFPKPCDREELSFVRNQIAEKKWNHQMSTLY